jgi:SAM-dependent methyltransferase
MARDHFGEDVASGYDEATAEMSEPAVVEATVEFLAGLAGAGAALELGIGTGRIALPLSRRGVRVHGIDLSPAMVAGLRTKPGGDRIPVTIGDFASTEVEGTFALAYLVFNTIMNLTTQDEQVACFRNVARHLEPGGSFVIEVMVPDVQRLPPGDSFRPATVTPDHLILDEYDVVNQGLISHHYRLEGEVFTLRSFPFRYAWPSELDLMARLAGMALSGRFEDWSRAPFTAVSSRHVSVWTRPRSSPA